MLQIKARLHQSPIGRQFLSMDPLFRDPLIFRKAVNGVIDYYKDKKVDAIVGIEGRGLILASTMAYLLGVPLVPARKAGKLPAAKLSVETSLGPMEIHLDALQKGQKVLIVDAVLDVEHGLDGAINLVKRLGAQAIGVVCLHEGPRTTEAECPIHSIFSPTVGHTPISTLGTEVMMNLKIPAGSQEIEKVIFNNQKHSQVQLLEKIKKTVRTIPHFPVQGIQFRDVTTIMQNSEMMRICVHLLLQRYQSRHIDGVMGIESRGFIFGAPLAYALGVPFIPVSKKGKTPGETLSLHYEIEYGMDEIEIPRDALSSQQKILVIDDLIATGGTAQAACELATMVGAVVDEVACVIELPDLHGREKVKHDLYTLVEFEGD